MGKTTTRVEASIRELVTSGEFLPGAKLPSERTLAEELSAGRTTIRLVLARLAAEGLIAAQHGRGYFVTKPPGRVEVAMPDPQPWKIHGERRIYDNRWVKLDLVNVEPPGLEPFEHHAVRLDPVAVAAVVNDDDHVLMLWRYRFITGTLAWELPGGIVDNGENPRDAAMREVEEETGWRPHGLNHVTRYEPMVGMVDSPHDVFVGRGADKVGEPSDPEEAGQVAWIPLDDIRGLMARRELAGSGTLVALLYLLSTKA